MRRAFCDCPVADDGACMCLKLLHRATRTFMRHAQNSASSSNGLTWQLHAEWRGKRRWLLAFGFCTACLETIVCLSAFVCLPRLVSLRSSSITLTHQPSSTPTPRSLRDTAALYPLYIAYCRVQVHLLYHATPDHSFIARRTRTRGPASVSLQFHHTPHTGRFDAQEPPTEIWLSSRRTRSKASMTLRSIISPNFP